MMNLRGKIFDGEKLLFDGVNINLEHTPLSAEGLGKWRGDFYLKSKPTFDAGAEFRLELSDGRGGDIIVQAVGELTATLFMVSFHGTGALSLVRADATP